MLPRHRLPQPPFCYNVVVLKEYQMLQIREVAQFFFLMVKENINESKE